MERRGQPRQHTLTNTANYDLRGVRRRVPAGTEHGCENVTHHAHNYAHTPKSWPPGQHTWPQVAKQEDESRQRQGRARARAWARRQQRRGQGRRRRATHVPSNLVVGIWV